MGHEGVANGEHGEPRTNLQTPQDLVISKMFQGHCIGVLQVWRKAFGKSLSIQGSGMPCMGIGHIARVCKSNKAGSSLGANKTALKVQDSIVVDTLEYTLFPVSD